MLGCLWMSLGLATACGDDAGLSDYFPDIPDPTGEAQGAFAGEVTGKNKPLWIATTEDGGHVLHGKSACAFSGQEDLQWYTDDGDGTARTDPTKGDPAHSQNWGHVKQAAGLTGGAGPQGCNPHVGEG